MTKYHVCMGCRGGAGGMVLPFEPMTMTFSDLHYSVPIAKVTLLASSYAYSQGLQGLALLCAYD